jgi:phosphoribosylaminoimidazolecarboxamide formyltransferase/IMP cyclohydrolase
VITYNPSELAKNKKEYRCVEGGLLVQDKDTRLYDSLKLVTKKETQTSQKLIEFGLKAIRSLKSNAITIVRSLGTDQFQLLGMGCGQVNRVSSVKLAIEKSTENLKAEFKGHENELEAYIRFQLKASLLVSEAFFPFPDNIELCHRYGIQTIVQPGGSLRDKDVIEACDRFGISMYFTGMRHFKH